MFGSVELTTGAHLERPFREMRTLRGIAQKLGLALPVTDEVAALASAFGFYKRRQPVVEGEVAFILGEPLGLREVAAMVLTLGGVTLALQKA